MRDAVIIIFYDIPMQTESEKREYRIFTKGLIRLGFSSIQKSVYQKYIINISDKNKYIKNLKEILPKNGNVKILTVNFNTYKKMDCLSGESVDFEKMRNPIIELLKGNDINQQLEILVA